MAKKDNGDNASRPYSRHLNTYMMQSLKMMAGEPVDTMLESPDDSERFLTDDNANNRTVAFLLFTLYWPCPRKIADLCETAMVRDENIEVRMAALCCLGKYYEQTHNGRIGRMLAEIIQDNSFSDRFRLKAYENLYWLGGGKTPILTPSLDIRIATGAFRFPDDVDWELVNWFLAQPDSEKEKGKKEKRSGVD